MRHIQTIFSKQVAALPKLALVSFLEQRTQDFDPRFPTSSLSSLADHILSGKQDDFVWKPEGADEPRTLTLRLTEDDAQKVKEIIERLSQAYTDLIPGLLEKIAASMFRKLQRSWREESQLQSSEQVSFKNNLEVRWGKGLDLLRMLLTSCREIAGSEFAARGKSARSKTKNRDFVLLRLQARACQITEEVVTLLENGFADGAIARWRTLHEIAVVSSLIADGDEALAERYISHDTFERKRAADEYELVRTEAGYPAIAKKIQAQIDKNASEVQARYGNAFMTQYGWASDLLGMKRPTFKDLQLAAGKSALSFKYKMASNNVHAGTAGISHRLASMGQHNVILAGRSNAGLEEAGERTAFTLTLITASLVGRRIDLDSTIELSLLVKLRDKATTEFHKAAKKLVSQERELHEARLHRARERSG